MVEVCVCFTIGCVPVAKYSTFSLGNQIVQRRIEGALTDLEGVILALVKYIKN